MRLERTLILVAAAGLLLGAPPLSAEWYRDYEKGLDALHNGDYQEAIEHLKRSITARPAPGHRIVWYGNRIDCYYPYFYLGLAFRAAGHGEEAREALRASRGRQELSEELKERTQREQLLARLARELPRETDRGVIPIEIPDPVIENANFGEYYALLIAIQDYEDPTLDLANPITDAETMAEILTSRYTFSPNNVLLLKNPDRAQIISTLTRLKHRIGPADNLLIFYAGHGLFDESEGQGYWLPRDAVDRHSANWISNSDIRDKIKAIPARHILLISDACFSGSIFGQSRGALHGPQAFHEMHRYPSRRAITSGAKETVPDRSVFIQHLVAALASNKEGLVHAQKLFINVQTAVINNSPTHQKPQYGVIYGAGDVGAGDFIFVQRSKE